MPFCKKDVPQSSGTCPYCQSDLRSWFSRHPFVALSAVAVFIIFLFFVAPSEGPSQQLQNTTADTSINVPYFQPVAIDELRAGQQIPDATLIRVKGAVEQVGSLNPGEIPSYGTNYFLKI